MENSTDPKWAEKQLTKEEAIEFAKSEIWKTWNDEQIVRFQLFQKLMAMDYSRFHKAMEVVLNRPVFTHEFAFRDDLVREYLGDKPTPTFDEIVNLIPEEKRIILNL